ncbi:hypothetical protein BKA70DRAFT_1442796 [Coprinopsis sp. MPI-PUGE-AT-0042]|nr:hypothetical protein BKA70DRAFT_1442796 [Coprinopsis sp. MPI-PUGE-AT-0042]
MHRCWNIPEIVREVCLFVGNVDFTLKHPFQIDEDADRRACRQSLVSLSMVCWSLSHIATQTLWLRVGPNFGIEPLLDTLPQDLWVQDIKPAYHRKLKRGLTLHDLGVLKRCSIWIQSLSIDLDYTRPGSIESLAAFGACATTKELPLFPNLQALQVVGDDDETPLKDAIPLGYFLGSQLHTLHITALFKNSAKNSSFLSSLTRKCPNLCKLQLGEGFATLDPRFVLDIVCFGKQLRAVVITTYSGEVIAALSQLPRLEKLELTIEAENDFSALETTSGAIFPALSDLRVTSEGDISICHTLIRDLCNASLSTLVIHAIMSSPLRTIAKLIEDLSRHINHSSLTSVSITACTTPGLGNRDEADDAILGSEDPLYLCSLQVFTELTCLEVQCETPAVLGMEPLVVLSRALPKLTVLATWDGFDCAEVVEPKLRIEDLPAIFKLFPSLQELHIPLDATAVPWYCHRPGDGIEHPQVTTLGVGSSCIDSVSNVAAYLSAIAPNIQSIMASTKIYDLHGHLVQNPWLDTWTKVETLAALFTRVRKQERGEKEAL